jgi:hypothetical protein
MPLTEMAARRGQSQDGESFPRGTRWQFAARTSHAPKNGQNVGFDRSGKSKLLFEIKWWAQ